MLEMKKNLQLKYPSKQLIFQNIENQINFESKLFVHSTVYMQYLMAQLLIGMMKKQSETFCLVKLI